MVGCLVEMRSISRLVLVVLTAASAAAAGSASPAAPPVEPTTLTEAQLARDRSLEGSVAAVVDAFANYNARLSPDGGQVLFLSSRSGVAQAYLAPAASLQSSARALTGGSEGVNWATFTRDGAHVLFTRDVGHDESFRIFRIALTDGREVDLTPEGSLHRDNPFLPADRPELMVFSARSRTSPATRVVVQPIAGTEGRIAYEDPFPARLVDVSADAGRALLLRVASRSDRELLEVDLVGGGARRIYPSDSTTASISDAAYGPDGLVLVSSDEGGELTTVVALDRQTGAIVARHVVRTPDGALADQLEAAPGGTPVAVTINAGNRSQVRILDGRTLEPRCDVRQPLGIAELGTFTGDGSQLALVIATPDLPWDVYVADSATGEVRPLRREPRPGLEGLGPIETTVASVEAFDGLEIPVHYYLPKASGEVSTARRPTIVFFHGGPAWSAVIAWHPLARFFVGQGYAWVEPNVRGSLGFGRAYELADNRGRRWDVLRDLDSVNRWVKDQPWCDPDRVVVLGLSYGGYLTLMALAHQPGLWRAGVDLFGVADLRTLLASTDATVRAALTNEFGDLEADAALLEALSPLPRAERLAAPLFVYAGQNDPRVPRSESDAIVAAARERGIPVEYMVAADEGHSFTRRSTQLELFSRIARFLEEHLAAGGSAP